MTTAPAPSAATGPARRLAAAMLGMLLVAGSAAGLLGFTHQQEPAGAAAAAAAAAQVNVADNIFQPGNVTVEVGESVTWRWVGDNPHSVAGGPWGSSHPGCSPTGLGCGTTGSTFTWTPSEAGEVAYNCEVHGAMRGSITVLASSPEPSPEPTPEPSPSPSPTASPSPSPTPAPTPVPTVVPSESPTPSPSPSPSASPRPSPSPSPTFGPPPPRETAPPVVVEPTASESEAAPSPRPTVTLEAFPAAPDPDEVAASEDDGAPVAATDGPDDTDRATPLFLALGLVTGTLVALFQFVLLGPEWVGPESGHGGP